MIYNDFMECDYKIFGLYGADDKGVCLCGNPNCPAAFKHPVASNWQYTPDWSEDQLEVMEMTGQLSTGYGVMVGNGLLVVDIDERNGGTSEALGDLLMGCGFIVKTGSGGASRHYYFTCPADLALAQHHEDYPGIDFKSSGFVVGPGSMHASGNRYDVILGDVMDIDAAPPALLELLKKPEKFRATVNGSTVDVSEDDLAGILKYVINDDLDYETFIRVGMAVHHITAGEGFDLWDDWAKTSDKYLPHMMERKWHSFGKSGNPVTLGTLIHYAEKNGYTQSVEFESTVDFEYEEDAGDMPFSTNGVDILRPPGFVGEVCNWINNQCRYSRENLAVAASLVAMGNICGLRHTDDLDGMSANLFAFCIAGSGTGKEAIQQAVIEIHRAAGIHVATHGAIKSEQEITRNLVRHQSALYVVDEMGELMQKLVSSKKNGGASYLQGVIGMLMSAYSKADGYMLLTGDMKEEITRALKNEYASVKKSVDENEGGEKRLEQIKKALMQIDRGLEKPFLSLIGFTTPVTFEGLITHEQATNGFIGRSLLITEKETNPRAKRKFKKRKMEKSMGMFLSQLYSGGSFDSSNSRVEYYGEKHVIQTTEKAEEMLGKALDWFEDHAELHKENTGLEAIVRRSYEIMGKVSLILASPEGVRTEEHVRWAFALVHKDMEEKTRLAFANDKAESNPLESLAARVISLIDKDLGVTVKYLSNRLRTSVTNIEKVIEYLDHKIVKADSGKYYGK